jgi:alpha-1,2-mannosyltransferase
LARPARALSACLIAGAAAPFLFAAAVAVTNATPSLSIAATTLIAASIAVWVWRWPAASFDWSGCSRAFLGVTAVAAILGVVALSWLTVFMIDSTKTSNSTVPSSDWELRHSCLTAYFVAADVVRRHPNVYDESLYAAPGGDPTRPRKPQMLGMFRVDQYEYPPPFLLAPRALSWAAPGFLRLRALWFGVSGLILLVALLVAARSLGARSATRALLLAPFVLASPATLSTLQKGNVQVVVIAVSVIAMALIARRHHAGGAALLACVTVAKLYPGLLVLYLIGRREWRAVAWTCAFAGLVVMVTIADIGLAPFSAFTQHLPGLLGGEAFPAFRNPASIAVNVSIPGVVFKLKMLGLTGMGFAAMHLVGTLYMLVAIVVTIFLGLRAREAGDGPLVWLTVLVLATLRSPFLPWAYGTLPAVWLVTVMAATDVPRPWPIWQWLTAVIVLGALIPPDVVNAYTMAILSTVAQLLMIAVGVLAVRHQLAPAVKVQAPEFAVRDRIQRTL